MMKTVYNKYGDTKVLDTVDAKEHVATGRWFFEPVANKSPKMIDDTSPDYVQSNESKIADDTSPEAYTARKEAFKQSEAETAAKVVPIEEEIKKNKLAKK